MKPASLIKVFRKRDEENSEGDVDLADEMNESSAEHSVKTGPDGVKEDDPKEYSTRQKIGLVMGPTLFFLMLLLPTPAGMEPAAQKMAAVAFLMATWWMCESIPIPATAEMLIPIGLAIIAHVIAEGKKEGLDKESDWSFPQLLQLQQY